MKFGFFRNFSARLAFCIFTLAVSAGGESAAAQSILRDTETEQFFLRISSPIYKAARVDTERLRLFANSESSINAFATSTQVIVLSAGLIERAKDPSDLQGVIAHEIGHIAAGHHLAGSEAQRYAERQYLLSAAIGLVLAGAIGDPVAFGAAGALGQEVATKGFLAHSRSFEQAADQAAINYLSSARQSPVGILRVMGYLQEQETISADIDPYLRTHPVSRERVNFLRRELERSPYAEVQFPVKEIESLRRIKAKLSAYLDVDNFHRRYPAENTSVAARYGRAVAKWREGKIEDCIRLLRALLQEEPDNPYFHEFLGQVFFTAGNAEESAAMYKEAVRLLPEAPLLRLGWASSLLELRTPQGDRMALRQLSLVNEADEAPGIALRLTNIAETRLGNTGRATLALAELRLIEGRRDEAGVLARRALKELSDEEQASRLRALDLLTVIGEKVDEEEPEDENFSPLHE